MLKVYENKESVCCHKVQIVLAEKSIPHQVQDISLETGEQKSPAFLAINPNGMVPVIDHDGRIVTQSTIIVEYLDEAFPGDPLMPDEPYWRARRRLWARWIDDEMHWPRIAVLSFNIAFNHIRSEMELGNGKQLPPMLTAGLESEPMRAALRAYIRFIDAMDRTLADHPWLAGPRFSLADIDVIPYLWRLANLQMHGLWQDKPRIAAWIDRVASRRSFQTAIIAQALPHYIDGMKQHGAQAWPRIQKMIASA